MCSSDLGGVVVGGGIEMTPRYLEDFAVGQTYGSGRIRIEGDRIKSFADEFDPQPFHLDDDAARNSIFRGLAASGWHTRRRSPFGSWSRASSSPLVELWASASAAPSAPRR